MRASGWRSSYCVPGVRSEDSRDIHRHGSLTTNAHALPRVVLREPWLGPFMICHMGMTPERYVKRKQCTALSVAAARSSSRQRTVAQVALTSTPAAPAGKGSISDSLAAARS